MNVSSSVLLLSFVATVYGASTGARLVGGTNAPDGKYPYMVAILVGRSFRCGGSILNKNFVLTAANCIKGRSVADVKVKYGTTKWNDTSAEWQDVEKLIGHKGFCYAQRNHNIALIKLKKEIVYDEKIQPVKLPTSDDLDRNFAAVVTGWGTISNDDYDLYSNDLKYIDSNAIPHEECIEKILAFRRSRQLICARTQVGQCVAYGDHGGPLVAGGYQIGVLSDFQNCALSYPSVFTRVYSYLDWIEEHSRL